jgi:hypothetical protein
MNRDLTVRDLLNFLQNVDPDLPVQIAMNSEYQWTAAAVTVDTIDDKPYVLIYRSCPCYAVGRHLGAEYALRAGHCLYL